MQRCYLPTLLIITLFAATACTSTKTAEPASTNQTLPAQAALNSLRIEQAEVMGTNGQKVYAVSIETPALPEQLINDLVARYGNPSEVLGPQNTWRSVVFEGIDEPVTLVISFNSVEGDAGTFYTTFVQAQGATGADLLVPGSDTRKTIEAYLRQHLHPHKGH